MGYVTSKIFGLSFSLEIQSLYNHIIYGINEKEKGV